MVKVSVLSVQLSAPSGGHPGRWSTTFQDHWDPHPSSLFCPPGTGRWALLLGRGGERRDRAPRWKVACYLSYPGLALTGLYSKYSRSVSQSPSGELQGRLPKSSVEEEIRRVALESGRGGGLFDCKFHAAGREDVDVRQLGRGKRVKGGRRFVVILRDWLGSVEGLGDGGDGDVQLEGWEVCDEGRMGRLQKESEEKVSSASTPFTDCD